MMFLVCFLSRFSSGKCLAAGILIGLLGGCATTGTAPETGSLSQPAVVQEPPQDGNSESDASVAQEAQALERALDLFLRDQKVLIKQGEFAVEWSTAIAWDSQNTWLPVEDALVFAEMNNQIETSLVTGRVGLFDRIELNVTVPYIVQRTEWVTGTQQTRVGNGGRGDINWGLKWEVFYERGRRPELIVDLSSSVGNGDRDVGGGIRENEVGVTFVKTLDPVVFFGRMGVGKSRENDGFRPGDALSLMLGTGFSLNDRVSLKFQTLGDFTRRSERNGVKIIGSNRRAVSFQVSMTTMLSRRVSIEPLLNIGLTEDANDAFFGINMPVQF